MSINVQNVSKSFGDFHALVDVSVGIDAGHLTAVLGRSGGDRLVLPDESRRISRLQALLQTDGTHCRLKNLSSVAVVQINEVELECAQEHVVRAGDAIRIGPYVLRAQWDAAHSASENDAQRARGRAANEEAPHPIPTDPLTAFIPTTKAREDLPAPPEPPTAQPAQPTQPVSLDESPRPADALLAAFLHGAGLDKVACNWSTDQLNMAGQLLALFANGTVELLSSRSILKREVRADMTILLDRENNPLKLLPDGSSALKQMFGLPFPGFMTPASAVEDAFHDLHAHQIAIVAGMRAALIDLLGRFAPERIAERAGAPSRIERMAPVLRSASLWESYTRMHRETALAVEDDFGAVFGKAFLNAYDEEVKRYQARRDNARAS